MRTNQWKCCLVLAGAAIMAAPGFATPIVVTNFSFETLPAGGLTSPCGAGCSYSTTAPPGWASTGGGQFQPGPEPNAYFNTVSDGLTHAYSNGGVLSQVVGPTVQLDMLYVLHVDLGYRLDTAFAGTANLRINGNAYAAIGLTPVQGSFATYTATYTGILADVGQTITIELDSNGTQGNWDNVQLDGSVEVPEPATLLLLGPALLMLRRRKRPVRG